LKKIAVFASGSGTNFQSIIDAVESGKITATICGLLASKPRIKAIERAREHNIPVEILDKRIFYNDAVYENKMHGILKQWSPDLIVLAGYLRKIPDSIVSTFKDRIINIHPSLLPDYGGKGFYGMHVHEAVIAHNEIESGCTVHVVSEEYDQGKILGQVKVPVYPDDTPEILQQRVLMKEHQLLVQVINELITQKKI
jgi:phosphoribosylglycinamide formyltransferase-1